MVCEIKNYWYIFIKRPKRSVECANISCRVEEREKSESDMVSTKKVKLTDLFLFFKVYFLDILLKNLKRSFYFFYLNVGHK